MINRVILVGRLTKDVELKTTTSGISVCSFTLAVNRRASKNSNQPTADFINCVAYKNTAELMNTYLHKGSQIGVEGRIQTRNYQDQTGRTVYVTEVIADSVTFLETKSQANSYGNTATDYVEPEIVDVLDVENDDLPF